MAKKKSNVVALPVSRRPLALALLLVVASVAAWVLWTAPARTEADTAKTQLETDAAALAANRAQLEALQSGKERSAAMLLVRGRELDTLLPTTVDRVALVTRMDQVAAATGVVLALMNPVDEVKTDAATAQQFDVQVTGSGEAITRFLAEVESSSSLMTVSGLAITGSSAGDPASGGAGTKSQFSASMKLRVWSFADATLPVPGA